MISKEFAKWWKKASPAAKQALARNAKTSYKHLSNAAHFKAIGAELAGKIEAATGIGRGELCDACRRCPHWQGTKGEG